MFEKDRGVFGHNFGLEKSESKQEMQNRKQKVCMNVRLSVRKSKENEYKDRKRVRERFIVDKRVEESVNSQ